MIFKASVIDSVTAELDSILSNKIEAQLAMAGYAWDVVMGLTPKKGKPGKANLPSWLYKFSIEQNLNDPEVKKGLNKAIKKRSLNPEELDQFYRLAKQSPNKLTLEEAKKVLSKNQNQLLNNWYHPSRDWSMCFCFYTDKAVSKMFDFLNNTKIMISDNLVSKTYKRMNLKKASILLFKDIKISGDKATPIPYQKLIV